MSISKGARFEIFKRDGFTCQYCGRKPPDVILEVDHIHPRALGGDDDEMNLVTSCFDCNRGKSAKELGCFSSRPDADVAWLETQQELSELRKYNETKSARDAEMDRAIDTLLAHWENTVLKPWLTPTETTMRSWIVNFGPDEVEYAITSVAATLEQRSLGNRLSVTRYVWGILWKRKEH